MILKKMPGFALFCLCTSLLCGTPIVEAAVQFELVARTSFEDGFELPARTDFSNAPVIINDRGEVAATLTAAEGRLMGAIWLKTAEGVKLIYGKAGEYLLRDLRFTSKNQLVFEQVNPDFESDGVFVTDPATAITTRRLAPGGALGTEFFGASFLASDGRIGYQSKVLHGPSLFAWSAVDASPSIVAATLLSSQTAGYTYLFSPSINDRLEFASKVRLGSTPKDLDESQPDEIRLWNADGTSVLIARDRDGDPASSFTGFDNGVALSRAGHVAFVANSADGTRAVWLWRGGMLHRIGSTAETGLSEIMLFHVVVNDEGMVAFRGKDTAGKAAVFTGGSSGFARIAGEGDVLPSDLGPARLVSGDSMVSALSGGLSINSAGTVVFRGTTVAREGSGRPLWSSAIYAIRSSLATSSFAVGSVK